MAAATSALPTTFTTTASASQVFTPAPSCFTSPLVIPKTSTPTTRGGTIYSTVTVGCPHNLNLEEFVSLKNPLPTDCCGPFAPASATSTDTYYAYASPLMARGQICPSGYVPRDLSTVNAETTAVCCPSNLLDGYGSTYCSSTYDGTSLASGSEYVTVTNTVAFALVAVWNQRILSDLSTTVPTNTAQVFASASSARGLGFGTTSAYYPSSTYSSINTVARSLGTMIGIIVGASVGLLVLCIIACCICSKTRRSRRERNAYNKHGIANTATVSNMSPVNETKTPVVTQTNFGQSPVFTQPPIHTGHSELYGNGTPHPNHELPSQVAVHQLHGQSSYAELGGRAGNFELPGQPVQQPRPGWASNGVSPISPPTPHQPQGNMQQQWPIMELPGSDGKWASHAK